MLNINTSITDTPIPTTNIPITDTHILITDTPIPITDTSIPITDTNTLIKKKYISINKKNTIIDIPIKTNKILLPTYPCDSIEKVETIDEFIQKFCEIGTDKRIIQCTLYEAFTMYISQSGFVGRDTFYNKIKSNDIYNSKTVPENIHGISLKQGVIPDIYIYVRDFLDCKCEFDDKYRISSSDITNAFIHYIDDLKIDKTQIRKLDIHKVHFTEIMKKIYPFKFNFITKKLKGWCGLKLKAQITFELSDLVTEFITIFIEKSPGNIILYLKDQSFKDLLNGTKLHINI